MILRRLFVVLAVLVPLAVVSALPAAAHVELRESQPEAGANLTTPPAEIFLRFTGPVEENSVEIRVTGPDGERVEVGETQSGARAAAVQLPELSDNGRYVVRYEGTSEDGHTFEGRLRFRLRVEQAPEDNAPADDATAAASEPADDDPATQAPAADTEPTSDTGVGVPWAPIAAVVAIVVVAGVAIAMRRRA